MDETNESTKTLVCHNNKRIAPPLFPSFTSTFVQRNAQKRNRKLEVTCE